MIQHQGGGEDHADHVDARFGIDARGKRAGHQGCDIPKPELSEGAVRGSDFHSTGGGGLGTW